jgi:predicted O-methyltransferase YrrM
MNNHRDVLVELVRERGWSAGAELGLASGQTFEALLRSFPNLRMVGVDRAINFPRRDRVREIVREFPDRSVYHEMLTSKAAALVPDGSLDFVFVDADHRYEAVKDDILRWRPKLREGGVMLGHDYNPPVWPGVVKAVHEIYGGNVRVHPHEVWEAL